uniref:Uncharacterized protein n=1 Tax=Caenorhabditis japonica TaxID=281687 RepID=A0A8R1ERD0_CAEJA
MESTKSAVKSSKTAGGAAKTKAYVPVPKTLRRGKRNVILEEIPVEEEEQEDEEPVLGTEEDVLRDQLSG